MFQHKALSVQTEEQVSLKLQVRKDKDAGSENLNSTSVSLYSASY